MDSKDSTVAFEQGMMIECDDVDHRKSKDSMTENVLGIELNGVVVPLSDKDFDFCDVEDEGAATKGFFEENPTIYQELERQGLDKSDKLFTSSPEKLSNPYDDLVDYEVEPAAGLPSMAIEDIDKTGQEPSITHDPSKHLSTGKIIVASTHEPTVSENNANANALFLANSSDAVLTGILPDYPFRYNISEKAQKQINDVINYDVAVADSSLQKLVSGLLSEKSHLERRCKEFATSSAATATIAETKYRQRVESLEAKIAELQKELDDLKVLHAKDNNYFDVECQEHEMRLELAMKEVQDATRKALFFRAEAKAKAPLVASARQQATDLKQLVEAMKKLLEEHNVEIPTGMLAPLTKDHRG